MAVSRSLRERIAGQSAMSEVVLAQSVARPRGALARFFGVSPLTARSRASYNGALGELLVGDVLDNLGPNWDVLHDLPITPGTSGERVLDHLVIGPAGVYAVHVMNCRDKDVVISGDQLIVGNETVSEIACTRSQAEAASELLSVAAGSPVSVRALLVVVDPRRLNLRAAADGVPVIPSHQLERFLAKAPRTLVGTEVAAISDLADLATTWPDAPAPRLDVAGLHRQFAGVRHEVRSALVRRVLWAAIGIALLYATVWTLVASFVSMIVTP